jgi:hypothetical protein
VREYYTAELFSLFPKNKTKKQGVSEVSPSSVIFDVKQFTWEIYIFKIEKRNKPLAHPPPIPRPTPYPP